MGFSKSKDHIHKLLSNSMNVTKSYSCGEGDPRSGWMENEFTDLLIFIDEIVKKVDYFPWFPFQKIVHRTLIAAMLAVDLDKLLMTMWAGPHGVRHFFWRARYTVQWS